MATPVGKHPSIPVTPEQIAVAAIDAAKAVAAIDAAKAGAAIAHIHVRDPATGGPSRASHLFREVVERIRASGTDVILNPLRPGPGTTLAGPEERIAHVLELKPELCSLDVGSMNFDNVFMNMPPHLRRMAELIGSAGVKPEMEAFDQGHLRLACRLIDRA